MHGYRHGRVDQCMNEHVLMDGCSMDAQMDAWLQI